MEYKEMDKIKLDKLIYELEYNYDNINWETNYQERIKELTKNQEDTIKYLKNCTCKEISWITETFDDLVEQFKTKEIMDCIEEVCKKYPEIKETTDVDLDFARKTYKELTEKNLIIKRD